MCLTSLCMQSLDLENQLEMDVLAPTCYLMDVAFNLTDVRKYVNNGTKSRVKYKLALRGEMIPNCNKKTKQKRLCRSSVSIKTKSFG